MSRSSLVLALSLLPLLGQCAFGAELKPIRALLITGGCCHDYADQTQIISEGVSARANVEWTIVQEHGLKDHHVGVYEKPGWAEGYDVVVHNECFDSVSDVDFIEHILKPHRNGTPAVVIHCTMHTALALPKTVNIWREFLGVTTDHHDEQRPLEVENLAPKNPIMKNFPAVWTTGDEELYIIDSVWPNMTLLARARSRDDQKQHAVIWTHRYGKGRVFGTTLAHNSETMRQPIYLDMLTRGLLWASDKLDDRGHPKSGYEPRKR
jgi:type 1 glutamine amidotransferase